MYDWRIDYEQSIAAYYVGRHDLGRNLPQALLERTELPQFLVDSLTSNPGFYDLRPG